MAFGDFFVKSPWARDGSSLYLSEVGEEPIPGLAARTPSMDDHDSANDDFGAPTLTKEVVRRYERQSQNDFEIELFKGVLKRRPDYVDVLRVLANNLAARGDRKASLAADRRLVKLRPNDAAIRYNLACNLCVLGRKNEAMDHLEQALELGYEHLEYLTEDRDLAPLHREPRFLKMLEKLLEESEA